MIDQIPKNWDLVKLGDVVEHRQELERNPKQTGFSRYLKVEHLDADCLKISRWGDISNGDLPPTFYKVFRTGQVLYPTRNPHLRRIAYADFDGICGEKTLTISPTSRIDSKLFPFIFQNPDFINYTTTMMIGSTNPHIRWRDVAAYKFLLPSLDEQRKIGEMLWAVEDSIRKQDENIELFKKYKNLLLNHIIKNIKSNEFPDSWKYLEFGSVIKLNKGVSYTAKFYADQKEGLPFITIKCFQKGGGFDWSGIKYYSGPYKTDETVLPDDILIANTDLTRNGDIVGSPIRVPYLDGTSDILMSMDISRIEFNPKKLDSGFLYYLLMTKKVRNFMKAHSVGTTVLHLRTKDVPKMKILLPALKEQRNIAKILSIFDENIDFIRNHKEKLNDLKRRLITDLLSGK